MKITFVGGGAMGSALIAGAIAGGVYEPSQITVCDIDQERLSQLADQHGVNTGTDAKLAVAEAEVIVVAVKPHLVSKALEPLRDQISPSQTVICIAAGVPISQVERCFSQDVPCVRVMPNTPCLVGAGAAAICLGAHADQTHLTLAHQLFDAVGLAVDVDEKLMDAVTGLSGSGPAYVYLFIEALADGGVRMGLSREAALQLAAQTVIGAGKMALQSGLHPGQLKDQVTSPGGTTIAAIHSLENNAFRGAVMDAVQASANKSKELLN